MINFKTQQSCRKIQVSGYKKLRLKELVRSYDTAG